MKPKGLDSLHRQTQNLIFLSTLQVSSMKFVQNDKVNYDEERGKKGMNAVNVTKIMD